LKVTAIKAQVKNENRVSIFIDNKYSFSLNLDQLLDQKLKKGDELEEIHIKNLKKLSEDGKLKQRALEWLLSRPHSSKELRDYLYKKKTDKELIEVIVYDFTEKGYLNDENFARWFAENRRRKNKSNRAISSELYAKGISSVTIQNILNDLNEGDSNSPDSEREALSKLVNKLSERPRYKDRQKLTAHLISKGFTYSDIKEALDINESRP
jgi:regulatory protein